MIVFWVSIISLLWTSSVRVNQTICLVFINTYSPVIKPTGHYHTCVSPQTPCTCRSRLVQAHYQGDQEYNLQRPHWPPPQLHLQRDQHKERERRGGRTLKSVHICLKVVRIRQLCYLSFLCSLITLFPVSQPCLLLCPPLSSLASSNNVQILRKQKEEGEGWGQEKKEAGHVFLQYRHFWSSGKWDLKLL